jgi:hypothetical protein
VTQPKRVSIDTAFLPEREVRRVVCGITLVEWNFCVVYVHSKDNPFDLPTHLYFSFLGSGDCYLDEIVALVDQWTFFRGQCNHTYKHGDHEYFRARKMAIQAVETYRRSYFKKHGSPPNPLLLERTLNEDLAKKKTRVINQKKLGTGYKEQLALALDV